MKDPLAVARGRARMSRLDDHDRRDFAASGGRASAAKLTPQQKSEKARKAARARWDKAESIKTVNKL